MRRTRVSPGSAGLPRGQVCSKSPGGWDVNEGSAGNPAGSQEPLRGQEATCYIRRGKSSLQPTAGVGRRLQRRRVICKASWFKSAGVGARGGDIHRQHHVCRRAM